MSTLTIRLPDDTAERLRSLARSRGLSVNKLVEEMSAQALAARDTQNRFRALAPQGDVRPPVAVLDRPDSADAKKWGGVRHDILGWRLLAGEQAFNG